MYIDKDNWGKFSINDLSEKDLRMFYESLKAYARCNFGHLHPEDSVRALEGYRLRIWRSHSAAARCPSGFLYYGSVCR